MNIMCAGIWYRMKRGEKAYVVQSETLKRGNHIGDIGLEERIILK